MSLFDVRQWWSIKLDTDEEFGEGCLRVGNVDNEPFEQGQSIIIIYFFSKIL